MKYFALLACLVLFACQSENAKEKDPNADKISAMEAELPQFDSLSQLTKDIELSLKEIELYTDKWVTQQSGSDNQDKLKLLAAEKKCGDLISKLEKSPVKAIKEDTQELKENFETLMGITADIKSALPDFASYEDIENVFVAEALISVDGEFYISLRKIQFNLQHITEMSNLEQRKLQLEIEKLKRQ